MKRKQTSVVPRRSPPAGKETLAAGGLLLLSIVLLAVAQPRALERYESSNTLSDVYALPDPEQLKLVSLGYRSALADLLFGSTLVAAGAHFSERKVFEHLDGYLRAIVTLEPKYRDVYYYADSLLTLSTVVMPKRNYRIARDLQEEGLKLFPDDADLWMSAGQFMAFLAVHWLPENEDRDEWRRTGSLVIQHACAIWPSSRLPASCLGVSSVLQRLGETEASIRSLERLVAVADDPAVRQEALARLEALRGQQAQDQFRARLTLLENRRLRDLPVLSRTAYQLVGPAPEVERCIGLDRVPGGSSDSTDPCVSSFDQLD